jgi:transposase
LRIPPGTQPETQTLSQKPEELAAWALALKERFPAQLVGVCLEQTRGALIYALSQYPWMLLYPINPKSLARYRESLYPSHSKNDPQDAELLCDFLVKHQDHLHPWQAEDAETRKLRLLLENRETLVDDRTRLSHRLRDTLKIFFPQALEWAGPLTKPMSWAFLLKWSSLPELQEARKNELLKFFYAHHVRRGDQIADLYERIRAAVPLVTDSAIVESAMLLVHSLCKQLQALQPYIDEHNEQIAALYARHPEKDLFDNLPGAGPVIGPRLVVAFGRDRQRYGGSEDLQQLSGIAPVTEKSGRSCWTHWRWAASAFLRQTFHEYAGHSIPHCAWAKAYYRLQRQRGKGHHAAVRALAFKWIRVLYRCWKDGTPYDDARYLERLRQSASPLLALLPQAPQEA